jgi:chaperonin GroES
MPTKEVATMKIRPLHDRVLVKRLEAEEKTKGGIIIPETAKEKPVEGKIIAVGNGRILDNGQKVAMDVKVGDIVLFGKYSGNEVKIDGEEHVVLKEDELYAIIDK